MAIKPGQRFLHGAWGCIYITIASRLPAIERASRLKVWLCVGRTAGERLMAGVFDRRLVVLRM